jgi:hypothetical protein
VTDSPPLAPALEPDAELDRIDTAMLALALGRATASERVAAAVTTAAPGPRPMPLHPARDILLLRKLVGQARDEGERDLVIDLWRVLIGADIRRQGPVDVVIAGAADLTRLYDMARRHFGPRTRIHRATDVHAALRRAVETEMTAVVLPWPGQSGAGGWWPALSESRHHRLALIAGLPLRGPLGVDPEAAIFAQNVTLAPAGEDITIALAYDKHHRAARALVEAGFKAREVARSEPTVLFRL